MLYSCKTGVYCRVDFKPYETYQYWIIDWAKASKTIKTTYLKLWCSCSIYKSAESGNAISLASAAPDCYKMLILSLKVIVELYDIPSSFTSWKPAESDATTERITGTVSGPTQSSRCTSDPRSCLTAWKPLSCPLMEDSVSLFGFWIEGPEDLKFDTLLTPS